MSPHSSSTRLRVATAVVAVALGAVACSSDSATGPKDGTVVRLNANDPTRDTLPNANSTLDQALDLRQTTVRTKRDTIVFVLRFTRPVASANAGTAASVYGYIDIDDDQNGATGYQSTSDQFGGSSDIGVDYFVDLFYADETSAPVAVFLSDGSIDLAGYAPTRFSGDSVVVRVPTDAIGGDEGNLDFTVTVGVANPDSPSDIAPNSGRYTIGGSGAATVGVRSSRVRVGVPRASGSAGILQRAGWAKWR